VTEIDYRGLDIPRVPLGERVTSDNLFDPNEQVIFDFYAANKARYRRVLDVGANIGVHSILMARAGWEVRAFEPDAKHFAMLKKNVEKHGVAAHVEAVEAAVSDADGWARFVRVLNNTTGSHIEGAKSAHGPCRRAHVRTVDCRPLLQWADFAKIDCEGHEATIICAVGWRRLRLDAMVEVGSQASAERIYAHLIDSIPMWAQKIGWGRVRSIFDMPHSHLDGSLFIGECGPFIGDGK